MDEMEDMHKKTLKCILCCHETFDSAESLKTHLLDVLNKLQCPICEENSTAFDNFTQHLKECEIEKNIPINESEVENEENFEDDNENDVVTQDFPSSEEAQAKSDYYCEICDVYFGEMKKHLMENHMGQQVVIESQDLEEIFEESDEGNQDDTGTKLETVPKTNTAEMEHIFLEHEILDDDGKFYTKKLTKINIIPDCERGEPVEEQVTFRESLKEGVTAEKTIIVYRCQNCNIRFSQKRTYNKHDCNSKSKEVCKICSIHCCTKLGLVQHKKNYHSDITEKPGSVCDVCNIQFVSEKSMILHRRIHDPIINQRSIDPPATYNINGTTVFEETNETFTCEICGREYNKKYEEDHMKSHNEESLNCSICNRKFLNKDDLGMHLQAHGNEVENKMSCRLCKKNFSFRKSLDDHVKNHCEERKYCCSFCGRRFSKPHEKVKHERIHTGHKPYVCQICNKCFRVSYCLTLHMRTHTGIRPYRCKTCDKRFKSHSAYRHHVQIHSDVRSYHCPYCPKAFKTAVQLAGHKNTHTKPFSCKTCSRPFASLYAVRQHMKSHDRSNEFKHQCHVCGAEYVRYFALKDHMSTHSELTTQDLGGSPKKVAKKKNKEKDKIDTK